MTRVAASILAQMVKRLQKAKARVGHIKYAGLQIGTIRKYNMAIRKFFIWLSSAERPWPKSLDSLDEALSEFINHLFQDDQPQGWASDAVCGFKRFYPKCRKSLQISSSYLRNWTRSVSRTQALPLTPDIVMSLTVFALLRGETRLAVAFILGFSCLLRTGEIVSLTVNQFTFLGGGSQLHIALPDSKGAKRVGRPESVILKQAHIVQFVRKATQNMRPNERVYLGTHASLGRDLQRMALCFGLTHPNLTPYGLRRGGATWLFQESLSYDLVQHTGRWSEAKTCKIYINEAMASLGRDTIPNWGVQKMTRCTRIFSQLLRNFPDHGLVRI